MGAGSSQEAEWPLAGDVRAGEWHLAADCLVAEPVEVRFEVLWRTAAGIDTSLVTWDQQFEPAVERNQAQTHDLRGEGIAAVGVEDGDQLIFRYTGVTGSHPMAWIPNGDGARTGGRIPFLDLP